MVSEEPTRKPTKAQKGMNTCLCIPSTIVSGTNARNLEQVTNIAYQIAKVATIYNVSEIVVLDIPERDASLIKDGSACLESAQASKGDRNKRIVFDDEISPATKKLDSSTPSHREDKDNSNSLLFATLLQYFVTPPYLVSSVFSSSIYKNKFGYAEKLPKLSTLPFMNNNGVHRYFREGLSIAKHTPKIQKKNRKTSALRKLKVTKYINIGESKPLELAGNEIPVNVRVTIDLKNKKVVSPQIAYGVSGAKSSFGYLVRLAKSFSSIFTELSFPEGYTESVFVQAENYFGNTASTDLSRLEKVSNGNILFVISNIEDLKLSFDQETVEGVKKVTEMFDSQVEVPTGLRIEDAAMIGLTKALL